MNHIDAIILGRLYERPQWLKSLVAARPRVKALVDAGLAERVRPCPQGARNMVQITPRGIDAIEQHWGEPVMEERPWTKDEDDTLAEMMSEGKGHRTIAKAMGRTSDSVKGRWRKIVRSMGWQAQ
ncbi:Myb-like DNA-binding domain-containing protein [Sphingopyxis sp. JAI128]|uniref:Myb-like DNA-binding domain-containing protein n=1 Tax=Sphingopyxis sp. JAI128 TaxID=2723066 RepID=UPI0016171C07|nr:Myb-like DNA-binding domain-containing protein [Sphingopyxis sp. JAI128]MBB6424972.1 DNA-binding NarL/FixJ family response regulator [Sphingopyxis sp. JAI128]